MLSVTLKHITKSGGLFLSMCYILPAETYMIRNTSLIYSTFMTIDIILQLYGCIKYQFY